MGCPAPSGDELVHPSNVSESTVMLKVHFIYAIEGLINHSRHKNLKIYFVFFFCVLCAFCGSKLADP
jgi:hypothetical protein